MKMPYFFQVKVLLHVSHVFILQRFELLTKALSVLWRERGRGRGREEGRERGRRGGREGGGGGGRKREREVGREGEKREGGGGRREPSPQVSPSVCTLYSCYAPSFFLY